MLKKIFYNRKIMVPIFIVIIVGLTLVALVRCSQSLPAPSNHRADQRGKTKPASTEVDGNWEAVAGNPNNSTSVGLPSQKFCQLNKLLLPAQP